MQTSARPSASVRSLYGPVLGFVMGRVINPIMAFFLASPRLHACMGSDTLMLLAFHGRRSGRAYRFPIGYLQQEAWLTCYSPFGWWRNLVGGVPVTVTLRGRRYRGTADVCTDIATIEDGMDAYLRHNPGDARYFSVRIGRDGAPDRDDVALAARKNVQIRIRLDASD